MNEAIQIDYAGRNERVGNLLVNRLLPGEQIKKVGPFVLLDHVYPTLQPGREPEPYRGQFAHPHRGIATLSYLLSGSLQYADSRDHHGILDSGGALWMKAGNGIIHDERPSCDFQRRGGILHALQFWINLPAANKQEDPELILLSSDDIPELDLPDNAGVLRVVLGGCGVSKSPLHSFLEEFVYHVRLNPKSAFSCTARQDLEYAAFIPADEVHVNGRVTGKSHLLVSSPDNAAIHLYNPGITVADVLIFGGGKYLEPIVSAGPFVMNSRSEIARAYDDFFAGRYGEIKFQNAAL
jgi:redox-sensitive bicupin YhaK (pirin superfamily)